MSAALVTVYIIPTAIKLHFKVNNHACACMVLPLNGFGSISFMLVYRLLQLWTVTAG